MTPHKNPRGAVALLVGDHLYLPDGRGVPFADVTGWEEADDATPKDACLAAARAAQAVIDARPAPKPVSRPLPVLEAPRAWKEDPEVGRFRARCAEVRAVVEALPQSKRRTLWLAVLDRLASMNGVAEREAWEAVDGIAACADGAILARLEAELAPVLAWAEALGYDAMPPRKSIAQAARRLDVRLRTRGWVASRHMKAWAGWLETWREIVGWRS